MESQAKDGTSQDITFDANRTSQGRTHGHPIKKKVQFSPIVRVHPVPREDRMGTWAQDGVRFRSRIHHVGVILEPVFRAYRDTVPKLYE